MKRLFGIIVMSVLVGAGAFAQTFDYTTVKSDFQGFSSDVAKSLPFATSMGLNWSDAYIGQLLHFGVGVSGGVVAVPWNNLANIVTDLGISSPNALNAIKSSPYSNILGIPLPSAQLEARIGGILLPFDLGIKVGTIPQSAATTWLASQGIDANYHMIGAELRYQLVKEKFIIPEIAVGLGLTHFDGYVSYNTNQPPITLTNFTMPDGSPHTIALSSPILGYQWNTNTLDLNVQVSKTILFLLTPYAGFGVSMGKSYAGGGFSSTVSLDGSPLTQSQIDYYNKLYSQYGQTSPFSTVGNAQPGLYIGADQFVVVPRLYGGMSVNLLFLKVDLTGMYNIASHRVGFTVGSRVQF